MRVGIKGEYPKVKVLIFGAIVVSVKTIARGRYLY